MKLSLLLGLALVGCTNWETVEANRQRFARETGATTVVCRHVSFSITGCEAIVGGRPARFACDDRTCWWEFGR